MSPSSELPYALTTSWPAGDVPLSPDRRLGNARGRGVVVAVVIGEAGFDDGAVVGERGPDPDRHPAAAENLVDAQHVHLRVERVPRAQRILFGRALIELLEDAMPGQMALERAVLGETEKLGFAPTGDSGGAIRVRPFGSPS